MTDLTPHMGSPIHANRGLPGNRDVIQHGLDEAAQSILHCADPSNPPVAGELPIPLARTEELLAAVTSPAVKAVLEARIEQIVKHGHTAEKDAELDLKYLPAQARSTIVMAMDLLAPNHMRNLAVGKRRLARAAAMLLAAIDRVDHELAVRGTDNRGRHERSEGGQSEGEAGE